MGTLAVHGVVQHGQVAAECLHNACKPRHTPNTGRPSRTAVLTRPGTPNPRARPVRVKSRSGWAPVGNQIRGKTGAVGDHLGAGLAGVVGDGLDEAIVVIHSRSRAPFAGNAVLHLDRRRNRIGRSQDAEKTGSP